MIKRKLTLLLVSVTLAACGGKPSQEKKEAPVAVKPPEQAPPPTAAAPAEPPAAATQNPELPPECEAYRQLIAKLDACAKLDASAKTAFKEAFERQAQGWATVPAENKAGLAGPCKAGADGVMQVASGPCEWQ